MGSNPYSGPWKKLGVQARGTTSARELLKLIGNVVGNQAYRYVWRGHGDVEWFLHTAAHRRMILSGVDVTAGDLLTAERKLLSAARSAGYGVLGNRQLSDVELLALLQHEGAATQFLDVTPDPFIALFFACEHALTKPDQSAALVALRVSDGQVVRDLPSGQPDGGSRDVLSSVRQGSNDQTLPYYLWQPPPLNERIKAQRGMFVIGDVASDPAVLAYSTFELSLVDRGLETTRVGKLLDPSVGKYIADGPPRIVVFRLSPALRRQLLGVLAKKFGYTTESIYPDFNGFARAHSYTTLINPGY